MHSFLTNDGIAPYGGVIQGADGSFYCSTYSGGASNLGSVFKLSLSFCTNTAGPGACSCPTLTTLHTFSGGDGSALNSELVLGPDGNFYGTTLNGGTSDFGTIFRIGADGSFTNLHKFAGFPGDGQNPYGGLVLGNDGNFYGAVTIGGSNAAGGFFRISPGGSLANLHSFVANTDGNSPESSLILGKDGNFYGTCTGGGSGKRGTVFQVTPSGTLTVLHAFSGPDGDLPFGGLVQGTNGDFYGTTHSGGIARTGSVFRVSSTGVFINLHSFNYVDGRWPQSALVESSDGNFYGTTVGGGTNTVCLGGCGTVFRISPDGTFTSLYSFDGNQSSSPFGALLLGKDGNFYGTTDGGGDFVVGGTVFQITPSGALTTLYSFTGGGDGRGPLARLIQGNDGALYGTTGYGGSTANCSLGCGTVFRLCLPQVVSANPNASIQFVGASPVLTISTAAGRTYQLQTRDSLATGNWINSGSPLSGTGGPLITTNCTAPLPPQRFYRFLISP